MRTITLSPNEQRRFGVGSFKFLLVREADEYINLLSDDGDTIRVDAGDKLDVSEFKELEIHNPHTTPIHVVYQLVKVDLKATPPTKVNFADSMAVSEVRSVVSTREQTAQRFVSREHITIEPNTKTKLCNASVTRLETLIQNISESETEAMIGDNQVSAVAGLPILGDRQAPAGITLTGGGELWAYNNSNNTLKLAMMEVHR